MEQGRIVQGSGIDRVDSTLPTSPPNHQAAARREQKLRTPSPPLAAVQVKIRV